MFENIIAERMERLHAESAFQILAEANALEAQGRSVIHCEIGQPDFATPDHIIRAAYEAMKAGYTGYSPSPGYPDVRAAIAREAGERKGLDLSPDNIIIVPGGKPIMFFTMLMLVSPGDEVLYPNTGFPIYESCIRFAGGKPVPVPLLDKNDFRGIIREILCSLVDFSNKLPIIPKVVGKNDVFPRKLIDYDCIHVFIAYVDRLVITANEPAQFLCFEHVEMLKCSIEHSLDIIGKRRAIHVAYDPEYPIEPIWSVSERKANFIVFHISVLLFFDLHFAEFYVLFLYQVYFL